MSEEVKRLEVYSVTTEDKTRPWKHMATKVRAERKKKKIQTVTQKYRSFLALNLRGQVKGDSLTEVSGRLTAEGDDRSCQSCQQTSFTLNTWSLQSSSAGQDPSPSPVCPSE